MYKRGDVYYIHKGDVRTMGSEQEAGRPAIIVSNDKANEYSSVVEVVYLTTKPKTDLPTHVKIRSTHVVSTALCEQINSIFTDRIGTYICSCTKEEMDLVDECLMISIGLDHFCDACNCGEPDNDDNDERIKEARKKVEEIHNAFEKYKETVHKELVAGEESRKELARTRIELDTFKTLYNELLAKVMSR